MLARIDPGDAGTYYCFLPVRSSSGWEWMDSNPFQQQETNKQTHDDDDGL